MAWVVHKFGGTSVADAGCYRRAVSLLGDDIGAGHGVVVVVSAQGRARDAHGAMTHDKVTSLLIECASRAARRDSSYADVLRAVVDRHVAAAHDLIDDDTERDAFLRRLNADATDLHHILKSAWLGRRASSDGSPCPWWTGYGELWSARLFAIHLRESLPDDIAVEFIDARSLVVVGEGGYPDMAETSTRWQAWRIKHDDVRVAVLTGFICATHDGTPSTLGRDGSDYSASIAAAMIPASSLTIWSDVDGVFSADPTMVPGAVVRNEMTYNEAMELAYFGAKVLHPKTMSPLLNLDIPIRIRNTFRPDIPGSRIVASRLAGSADIVIQGFSTIMDLMLINVEGTGMIGVSGIAHRLFGAIHRAGSSVILITQAGSEHSICLALPYAQASAAVDAIYAEFRVELEAGDIQTVDCLGPCACLAAVGDGMRHATGIAGQVLTALGRANINIRAIAQGASERNISVVIDQVDASAALNAVHGQFVSNDANRIIALATYNCCDRVQRLVDSIPDLCVSLWNGEVPPPSSIVIDCSGDDTVDYVPALKSNCHVITCNVFAAARASPSSNLWTHGITDASVPFQATVAAIHDSGDTVERVVLALPDSVSNTAASDNADASVGERDCKERLPSRSAHRGRCLLVVLSNAIGMPITLDDIVSDSETELDAADEECDSARLQRTEGKSEAHAMHVWELDLITRTARSGLLQTKHMHADSRRLSVEIYTRRRGGSDPIALSGPASVNDDVIIGLMQSQLTRVLRQTKCPTN
ncbi:aspartate kinase [Plasmodiophora brassicae]